MAMAARFLTAGTLACGASLFVAATTSPAAAADVLMNLERSMQNCIETSQAAACREAEAQVGALTRNRAYAQASHLCKEEIGELAQVVALLPLRDTLPTEVMASVADVQQACQPYGF